MFQIDQPSMQTPIVDWKVPVVTVIKSNPCVHS